MHTVDIHKQQAQYSNTVVVVYVYRSHGIPFIFFAVPCYCPTEISKV